MRWFSNIINFCFNFGKEYGNLFWVLREFFSWDFFVLNQGKQKGYNSFWWSDKSPVVSAEQGTVVTVTSETAAVAGQTCTIVTASENNRERGNNLLLPLHRVIRRNRSTHGGGGWAPLPDHVAGLATPPTDQTRERAGLGTMTGFVTNGALGRPARIPHGIWTKPGPAEPISSFVDHPSYFIRVKQLSSFFFSWKWTARQVIILRLPRLTLFHWKEE